VNEVAVAARYLDASTRTKIARDRREGFKLWRIARDVGLSVEVVREVLISKGWRRVQFNHPSEVRK